MKGDYTPAGVHYSRLSIQRILVYGIVCIAASQPRPAPQDEVRIRSAIYSRPATTEFDFR